VKKRFLCDGWCQKACTRYGKSSDGPANTRIQVMIEKRTSHASPGGRTILWHGTNLFAITKAHSRDNTVSTVLLYNGEGERPSVDLDR
jgi:hypothetical protein